MINGVQLKLPYWVTGYLQLLDKWRPCSTGMYHEEIERIDLKWKDVSVFSYAFCHENS